jgi:trigger factor
MKTSLVKLDGLNRSLTVELPIDTFNVKTDKVLKNMASQVKIDGFRKGKAPITLLKKRFGASASADAANEVVSETLADALEDSKSKPAVQPSLTNIDSKDSETFSYTVEFEIFPEIKSPDFSKIKVEQINFKITKEDEDRTLNGLKEQLTEYSPVKRKSKIGDRLTINFKGLIDGEVFDGGEAENFNLVLGKGSMIEGFEEGLTDIATNKDVTLNLSFPKDYHAQNLAAKDVTFEVNIKEIGSPKAPKMDEKFAEKFAEKSMDDLRVKIKEQMQMEAEGIVAKQNKDAVFSELLVANEFEVPQASIKIEAQSLLKEMESSLEQQGIPSNGKMPASDFNEEATRRVKLGFLVSQIVADNKLTADKDQVNDKLIEISHSYGENAQQMIDYYKQDPQRLSGIESLVIEQMVVELVLETAKVKQKNMKFQEITQQR